MKKNRVLSLFMVFILALFLRSYNLDQLLTPYWEEVALGYDAYSIALTGADHHGNSYPVVAFESFGDWKPSGYFYLVALSIRALGLSVFAVRLPSMLAGVAIVVGMYFLSLAVAQVFFSSWSPQKKQSVGLLASLLAAVSSWLLMFSRAAWEVNVATAFLLWGIIFSLWFIGSKRILTLLGASFFFAASAYTYHATRLIAPLLFLMVLSISALPLWYQDLLKKESLFKHFPKKEVLAGLVFLLLLTPLVATASSPEVTQRFAETSIFSDLSPIERSNEARALANVPLSNLFFHRYWFFAAEALNNATSHFTLDFLFVHGDANKRHSTNFFGQLYYLDGIFLLVGSYALVRRYKKAALFLFMWVCIGLIPASISTATPHALRILPIVPVLILTSALGIVELFAFIRRTVPARMYLVVLFLVPLLYATQVGASLWYYLRVYPQESALEWQYGYKQVMEVVHEQVATGASVAVSRSFGRPAMYYFFTNTINPREVQAQKGLESYDQSELTSYKTITFYDHISDTLAADVIFMPAQDEAPFLASLTSEKEVKLIFELYTPSGTALWKGYARN